MNDFEWSEAYKVGREAGWSEAIAWFASGKMPADGMPVGFSVQSGKITVDTPSR